MGIRNPDPSSQASRGTIGKLVRPELWCDCSLQYLKKPKQAHGRIARWSMILSEYDYEITYIKGSTNHVGDTLSRLIRLPEKDWINLEVDDDTVHPFLCMFPALMHASVQLLTSTSTGKQSE
eukprot:SAG31_NODE_25269_length_464_cov_2.745205_1_plen_121_part_10